MPPKRTNSSTSICAKKAKLANNNNQEIYFQGVIPTDVLYEIIQASDVKTLATLELISKKMRLLVQNSWSVRYRALISDKIFTGFLAECFENPSIKNQKYICMQAIPRSHRMRTPTYKSCDDVIALLFNPKQLDDWLHAASSPLELGIVGCENGLYLNSLKGEFCIERMNFSYECNESFKNCDINIGEMNKLIELVTGSKVKDESQAWKMIHIKKLPQISLYDFIPSSWRNDDETSKMTMQSRLLTLLRDKATSTGPPAFNFPGSVTYTKHTTTVTNTEFWMTLAKKMAKNDKLVYEYMVLSKLPFLALWFTDKNPTYIQIVKHIDFEAGTITVTNAGEPELIPRNKLGMSKSTMSMALNQTKDDLVLDKTSLIMNEKERQESIENMQMIMHCDIHLSQVIKGKILFGHYDGQYDVNTLFKSWVYDLGKILDYDYYTFDVLMECVSSDRRKRIPFN